jgi:hypothetical protein
MPGLHKVVAGLHTLAVDIRLIHLGAGFASVEEYRLALESINFPTDIRRDD